jgi:hypothetical protein
VDLCEIQLADKDLSGSNLTGANLSGMDLRSCVLRDAVLWEADLRGANLFGIEIAYPDAFVRSLFDADASTQMQIGSSNPPEYWVTTHGGRHAKVDGTTVPVAVRRSMVSMGIARSLDAVRPGTREPGYSQHSCGQPTVLGFSSCKHVVASGSDAERTLELKTLRDKSGRAATIVKMTRNTKLLSLGCTNTLSAVIEYYDGTQEHGLSMATTKRPRWRVDDWSGVFPAHGRLMGLFHPSVQQGVARDDCCKLKIVHSSIFYLRPV